MGKKEKSFDQRSRIWSFNEYNTGAKAYDVCWDGEDGVPQDKLVAQIPITAWRRGAINFEEWDKSQPSSAYWRQIFSMFCHLANTAVETYTDMMEADERRSCGDADVMATARLNGPPVKMYIETVFATDDATGAYSIPRAVAYRLHLFLFAPSITFGGLFWNMLEANRSLRKQELDDMARFKSHGFKSILPHQHYKLINSVEHYAKLICGLYTGHQAHWNKLDELVRVPAHTTYKEWRITKEFLAHPCNIFTLENAMKNYRVLLTKMGHGGNKHQLSLNQYE